MRLLNIWSKELVEFFGESIPLYYILSHRWVDGEEASFKEFRKRPNQTASGYRKIHDLCDFLRTRARHIISSNEPALFEWEWGPRSNVEWVWIDTICIDKRSSAELTEAINSMFNWYQRSTECIAYLADVDSGLNVGTVIESLGQSLCMVVFCDARWRVLGHKCVSFAGNISCRVGNNTAAYSQCLLRPLSDITYIAPSYLIGGYPPRCHEASVAQRMSWASRRTTTRIEDEAYCLLGLFGVNMPLIYGEGRGAFLRLQEEIIKISTDQSIFAWSLPLQAFWSGPCAMLATSIRDFTDSGSRYPTRNVSCTAKLRLGAWDR
ncbi:hypothetical protein K431DRAFT_320031 [Polychaeton citri CBS 116435]|uniref:Heterokaryon incompatibility domain-containing protein n=1 Tax=Polychaeton citri CBS 116435 TaxID=1314669 RepID=A0A9P4QBR7_9PEZI|nr:hypothetical protein K431DRAFT_320031 [Polychaeton citri CBS 116435]